MSKADEISKVYDPQTVEGKIYSYWENNGLFKPEIKAEVTKNQSFSIVIPPPNVTGNLHMGHALNNTLQDIMARFKRMQGYNTLWLPGTDHAGIATQNVVERSLAKEKIRKEDLGREAFIQKVWEWKKQYGSNIINQLKRLGSSCDWSRLRFTMDEGLSKAVRKAFVTLYNKGYIYRGKRIINWCPGCLTALSDIEVEHETIPSKLWYLKYPLADTKDEYVIVATTRPETMLGDTAVAVNPKDKRYKKLIGKSLMLPLVNRPIPIISDDFVDSSFGSGAVKVTPAHDPNDFEMGLRHKLDLPNVIQANGKIDTSEIDSIPNSQVKKYHGLDRFAARKEIVGDLESLGLIDKIDDYELSHGKCYRCKNVIEPYLSDQWFVKMTELAKPAIKAVEKKEVQFTPDKWTKVYLEWMKNIRDWCISRQIWWGHQIPVWYCPENHITVSETTPSACSTCGSKELKQETDVLDTWFSSSLWPFSTMGWPDNSSDLNKYYPTSVLITGYDIIFFWVSRMIFMGMEFMKKAPFHDIYITGLIRDITGKKMSKSLGNVIDPLDLINHTGADSLRFALTSLVTAQGQDLKLSENKVIESRNFATKIWNVFRFVMMHMDNPIVNIKELDKNSLSLEDKWILSRLNHTIADVT
ncbi:MAG: valine--tRNA ligase, partial [bacterium]